MKILELQQRSPEWHNWRKNHICGTDSPVICGISPYKTPYQLWLEKLGLGKTFETNFDIERGVQNEQKALELLSKTVRIDFKPLVCESTEHAFLGCSLDGYYKDNFSDESYICEIKCPRRFSDKIADHYYYQIQHQLIVSGAVVCFFCEYVEGEIRYSKVYQNKETQEKIVNNAKEFFKCLKEFESPELTNKDFVEKKNSDWRDAALNFLRLQETIKEAEEMLGFYREKLVELADDNSCIGSGIRLTKVFRKGNIDYSKIPELKSLDLEKYRKQPCSCWRITTNQER